MNSSPKTPEVALKEESKRRNQEAHGDNSAVSASGRDARLKTANSQTTRSATPQSTNSKSNVRVITKSQTAGPKIVHWAPFRRQYIKDTKDFLPTAYRHNHDFLPFDTTTEGYIRYLKHDLDVSRIEKIQGWLWICGRQIATPPLHHQKGVMERQVVATDRLDLHLTWDVQKVFMKPLPAYLLDLKFWGDYIVPSELPVYRNSVGLLLSYVHLIHSECDFYIARDDDTRLLLRIHKSVFPNFNQPQNSSLAKSPTQALSQTQPQTSSSRQPQPSTMFEAADATRELTWEEWRLVVEEISSFHEHAARPPIFKDTPWAHGELRIPRLNIAYRLAWFALTPKFLKRGYFYGYRNYSSFLSRNFAGLIAVFAYIAVVHGAMQVGLSTPQLAEDPMFTQAGFGFAIFNATLPAAIVGIVVLWFIIAALDNLRSTVWHIPVGITNGKKPHKNNDEEAKLNGIDDVSLAPDNTINQ